MSQFQQPQQTNVPQPRLTNGAAITSLILGLLGCIPVITSLLAIILGALGIKKTSDPRYGGKGMAITGLILGILGIAFWILMGVGGLTFARIWTAGTPARQATRALLQDVDKGDAQAAISHCDPSFSLNDATALVVTMNKWGKLLDVTFTGITIKANTGTTTTYTLTGIATFAGGTNHMFRADVIGSTWKIKDIQFDK